MSKERNRLAQIYNGPRTFRSLIDAFGILARSKPRDLGNGCFSLQRETFGMRFVCTRSSVQVFGFSPLTAEFLWFDGRLSELPKGMKSRASSWAARVGKPAISGASIFSAEPTGAGGSHLRYPLWFKEKEAEQARQRFRQNTEAYRQQTRSAPIDAIRMGGTPGHTTDNE